MDGLYSGMIVWQHDPGPPGVPEILARRYDPPSGFGPELVLSSPTLGPTDAAGGIATAGDLSGDAAAVWLQGAGSSTQIVAAQLYRAPGGFAPEKSSRYARTTQPVLSWSTPKEEWALSYQVTVDGVLVGQTTATSLTVPAALTQGPHKWQVTAVNGAGVTSKTKPATVFVDTIPPLVSFKLTGRLRAGSTLHIYVSDTDAPPGVPPADASGVATVKLSWGDGTSYLIKHGKYHVYKRPGHYLVKVKVTDRAGNVTTVERVVKIAHKPVPRRKHRRKRAKS
jgi:hypothetical protein